MLDDRAVEHLVEQLAVIPLYTSMAIRNWATTWKLAELAAD